jgi:hypothetical protein
MRRARISGEAQINKTTRDSVGARKLTGGSSDVGALPEVYVYEAQIDKECKEESKKKQN